MKATLFSVGVLLLAAGISPARAQEPVVNHPMYQPAGSYAPSMTGPGCFGAGQFGQVYGPNYCACAPGFPPYSGVTPQAGMGFSGGPQFRVHPFVRSPRDFFMMGD
jgi:hypothetical protein